jgi:formylglycine-generating enzyme required for sulfatase activity
MSADLQAKLAQIEQTIASLKNLLTGAALIDALKPLLAEQARLTGAGMMTQASVQTGGERSAVGSSAGKNLITGDGNSVQTIINYYREQSLHPPDETTLRRQIVSYLTWMLDRYGTIELRGIKREGEQVVQLKLETVYVPLQANTYRAGAGHIALDQVLRLGQHIVITGAPGCGKTTVLLHLAYTLSCGLGTDDPDLTREKLGIPPLLPSPPEKYTSWEQYAQNAGDKEKKEFLSKVGRFSSVKEYLASFEIPIPILIPLSTYALYLRQLPPAVPAEQKTLASFISTYLIQNQTSFELPPDFFKQLLRSGQRVMLLLDGLDEVPNEAERAEIRQAIENLVTGREQMQVVVTCRTAAYKDRTALGQDFREVWVSPLDEAHIERLVRHAYADIYRHETDTGRGKADELLTAIARLEKQRRQRFGQETEPLITSPLLVRMLLVVHYSERRLPDQRAELYMKATDAMLLPEYSPDETQANRIGGLVGGSREVHRELVQHLAFEMHRRGATQGREIEEDELRRILQSHPTYADLTGELMAITRLRGTLLEERLGVYRFIHLAFQEYMVARYLAETVRSEKGLEGIAAFLEGGPILESWWREPALLVVGYLSVNVPASAQKYLLRLAGIDEQMARSQQLSAEVQLAVAEVALRSALEWPGVPPGLKNRLIQHLVGLFEKLIMQVKPNRRVEIGNFMANLGDPRPGITDLETMEFCYVPPGPFMMDGLQNECLCYSYWLARYPVTVTQFATFVETSGYRLQKPDSLQGLSNHPVVNIAWREALAFCDWLTGQWQQQDILPEDWRVTLPSEAEWEKAARGGLEIPQQNLIRSINNIGAWQPSIARQANPLPQRRYPWGDKLDPQQANFDKTEIGTTSALGCFPEGVSLYGCQDMSGNVWEWTRSQDKGYPYDPADGRENLEMSDSISRVLRGGSFCNNAEHIRCAARVGLFPFVRLKDHGFRVLILPVFS